MDQPDFRVGVNYLNYHICQVGGVNHEENHQKNGIALNKGMFTASIGFLAKGPGAKVESVPVEKNWP